MTKEPFGMLPSGAQAFLYTISCGKIRAKISDFGATLVRLYVPDKNGLAEDVVLGFDDANGYRTSTTYFGATVGRNANRIQGAAFQIGDTPVQLTANENGNSLHSGPDSYAFRLWQVVALEENRIQLSLHSPHGDQGFPGNAEIRVTYAIPAPDTLTITYEGLCDQDTVFNLTNHSYFNLAGHFSPELAMEQTLCIHATHFTPADAESIPTGECRSVAGTPMDFRTPKAIGRDIDQQYECLALQGGYDHNFELDSTLGAILSDPHSGRTMEIHTDCPCLQFYSGNFLRGETGKDGVNYCYRGGIALETQFRPNAVNDLHCHKPIVKAGTPYRSQTTYCFK